MKLRMEVSLSHEDRHILHRITEALMGFNESIAKLDSDVKALIAQGSTATATAVAAAVAAKDASDAAAVDAIDAQVVAQLPPAPPAPAPTV